MQCDQGTAMYLLRERYKGSESINGGDSAVIKTPIEAISDCRQETILQGMAAWMGLSIKPSPVYWTRSIRWLRSC
ncbi:MAG: hypothetical protein AMJ41_00530 [candidate division Zixibacteria bacterium DG_27]|nr:MAG: hypothetical protein AMJ41_00530 [candidate division Zixibacteria bacterium DG_27]